MVHPARKRRCARWLGIAGGFALIFTPAQSLNAISSSPAVCVGDCSHDGRITIAELVQGVAILLGSAAVEACDEFDADSNARVSVDELILGVAAALNGCPAATAINVSTETACAEVDNVNVALRGSVSSFLIQATHPTYAFDTDNCMPDFTNCEPAAPGYTFSPLDDEVYDDGTTIVRAVRESEWWQPQGMAVTVDEGSPLTDIHRLVLHHKILGAESWPEVLVVYQDGNVRVKPHQRVGSVDPCFGSSVLVGAAEIAPRPVAPVEALRYRSSDGAVLVTYADGGSAVLTGAVDRSAHTLSVAVSYATDRESFATFRSMFVADGRSCVDHVEWIRLGVSTSSPILDFRGGPGSEWFFYRETLSVHNTSAPDIRIKIVE